MTITTNKVVAFDYETKDIQGNLIENTEDFEPLEYLHGHDQILPALEAALDGMAIGEQKTITINPEDGYGEYDESLLVKVRREAFADHEDQLKIGGIVDDEQGQEYIVVEIAPDTVTIDGNHPLAGITMISTIKVIGIRDATPSEIAHGHAHPHGLEHD